VPPLQVEHPNRLAMRFSARGRCRPSAETLRPGETARNTRISFLAAAIRFLVQGLVRQAVAVARTGGGNLDPPRQRGNRCRDGVVQQGDHGPGGRPARGVDGVALGRRENRSRRHAAVGRQLGFRAGTSAEQRAPPSIDFPGFPARATRLESLDQVERSVTSLTSLSVWVTRGVLGWDESAG